MSPETAIPKLLKFALKQAKARLEEDSKHSELVARDNLEKADEASDSEDRERLRDEAAFFRGLATGTRDTLNILADLLSAIE